MAFLNTGCSVSTIQADITGLTTGYAAECFAILAGAVDGATSDRCVTVPTSGSLPSLYPTQTIPDGQVLFVEDVGVPVIAASGKWIGFDKRVLRRDAPVPPQELSLFTWGFNGSGGLGDGTTSNRSSPVSSAGGGTIWSIVSAGNSHTIAIKSDGTLWTWGNNGSGRLGDGTITNRSSPGTVAGGGTSWCFAAAGGYDNSAAIKTDGTLWTWGRNNPSSVLGDGTSSNRSSPGTTAGGGTTWCMVSIGAGGHGLAIKTDGTLWAWGGNSFGQLGDGTTTARTSPITVAGGGTTWCAVSAGNSHSAGVKTDGTLWTWGFNGSGRLGDGTTTNRSSPGTLSGGGTTWCAVCLGALYGVGLKTDGTLWTWGSNSNGRLGDGTTTSRSSPGTVAGGGTTWCAIAAGRNNHSAAIKTDGTLWTWGGNGYGQLGDNTLTARSSPGTIVGGATTWKTVTAGYHTAALRS